MMPTFGKIKRHSGVAGQYSVSVEVAYRDEPATTAVFVASVYGGPVVMVMPSGRQVFVSKSVTDRLGSQVNEAWIRAFFKEN